MKPVRFDETKERWTAYYASSTGEKLLGEYETKRDAELAIVEKYSKLKDELKNQEKKKAQKSNDSSAAERKPSEELETKRKTEIAAAKEAGPNDESENQDMNKVQRRNDDENTTQIKIRLNIKTEKDILDKLDSMPNKQSYIKKLIRKDINKT